MEARKEQDEAKVWAAYEILSLPRTATGHDLAKRYRALLPQVKANPQQRALVKQAYNTIKYSKQLAKATEEAKHKAHGSKLHNFQAQQALAVLGLGDAVEAEVHRRFRELKALEHEEDQHTHQKPRKHSAVEHAYHKVSKIFGFTPPPKQ